MNVVILCPDQLRADYLSCYGHPTIGTSHIDALASEGVLLERTYCAAPLCGPSRISFVTSTRFSEHNHRTYGSTINFGVPNLVSSLKAAGFRTAMFGKNHCFNEEQLPSIWDEMDNVCAGNYDRHPKYQRSFDAFELEADHEYNLTPRLTRQAVDFLHRQKDDKPFLLWVNWQEPHPAFTCTEPYFSMFDPESQPLPIKLSKEEWKRRPKRLWHWHLNSLGDQATNEEIRRARAAYMGQVRSIDDAVGSILKALRESGHDEDTLILFLADHGELLGDHGSFHKIGVFYDALTRIPVIIRHPQNLYRGIFHGLVEEVDLAPTLLEACGIRCPLSFVGESLHTRLLNGQLEKEYGRETAIVETGTQAPTWPVPFGENQKAPFAPNHFGPGSMISDGRYKLSIYYDDQIELYDLKNDPGELTNRFDDPELADVRTHLTETLCRRLLGVGVRDIGQIVWPESYDDPRDVPFEVAALRPNPRIKTPKQ